jgi:hypothetical protein
MPAASQAIIADPIIAKDIASGRPSEASNILSDISNMQAQASEDTRYDVAPPVREKKEGFKDASSDRLAIFAVLAIATFIIISRSSA